MTFPRSQLVSEEEPGFYHVVSRCVRRAFLCGKDQLTGRCFEHRRQWIEYRIMELADAFAVSIYSYAVMSNHFHVVLHVAPDALLSWSDEEVTRRWLAAFPGPMKRSAGHPSTILSGRSIRLVQARKPSNQASIQNPRT